MIGVHLGKDQLAGDGGHVEHPGEHAVAQETQPAVHLVGDKVVITARLEELAPQPGNPFLEGAQRADPAAEDRSKEERQQKAKDHQHK